MTAKIILLKIQSSIAKIEAIIGKKKNWSLKVKWHGPDPLAFLDSK